MLQPGRKKLHHRLRLSVAENLAVYLTFSRLAKKCLHPENPTPLPEAYQD